MRPNDDTNKKRLTNIALAGLTLLIGSALRAGDLPVSVNKGKVEYSVRNEVHVCASVEEKCAIDTFVSAKAIGSGELYWERRIFFRSYNPQAEIESQVIGVKTLKFTTPKTIEIKNDRGDIFILEAAHGHMKAPTTPKEYTVSGKTAPPPPLDAKTKR